MGEIADMMLEGILCEGCGELLDLEGAGFPGRCASCSDMSPRTARSIKRVVGRERHAARHNRERKERARLANKPFKCACGKLCRTESGLAAHRQAKHGSGGW